MEENLKTVVVTGANSGMGKAICKDLIGRNYQVIMLCRDQKRGDDARLEILKETGGSANRLDLVLCDLGDLGSIGTCCESLLKKYDHLDVLINNAGVILTKRRETKDGFEMQLGVNHLGHFLLTKLLLPLLEKGASSRIVVVTSGAHKVGKIYFEDLQLKKGYSAIKAYGQSKLANVLFTKALSERLKSKHITVNCVHPGAVATQIGVDRGNGFGKTIMAILKPFFQTPLEGAATTLYLATSNEVADVTGQYFYKKKIAQSSKLSNDRALQEQLWQVSEALTE